MSPEVPKIFIHSGDLPSSFKPAARIAVDCEMMGLKPLRDKLCLIQISNGDGIAHLVKFDGAVYKAPNLKRILADSTIEKIFHFARSDLAFLKHYLDVTVKNVYCTRIASYLARTNATEHGLKAITKELLDIEISKEETSSDWNAAKLSDKQTAYAAADVLYLHQIRDILGKRLKRDGRDKLAKACFEFLDTRAALDLSGFDTLDIFAHGFKG